MRGEMKERELLGPNYILPQEKTDSFHGHCFRKCWARTEILAIFFGLSGTWKTTLSADAKTWNSSR